MKEQMNKEIKEIKKGLLRTQDSLCELKNTIRLERLILHSVLINDMAEIGESEIRCILDSVCDSFVRYCEALENIDCMAENTRQKVIEVFKNA